MSLKEVKKVIMMMVEDETFENEVFENPKEALSGFELSQDEIKKLSSLNKEKLKKISMNLDKRLSKDESWWVDSIAD